MANIGEPVREWEVRPEPVVPPAPAEDEPQEEPFEETTPERELEEVEV